MTCIKGLEKKLKKLLVDSRHLFSIVQPLFWLNVRDCFAEEEEAKVDKIRKEL